MTKSSAKTSIITRTTCRVCEKSILTDVLSLGNQSISTFLDSNTDSPAAPLELVLCEVSRGGCGLLQLRHTADQDFMYRNYWYRSGVNATMRTALADITNKAEQLVSLNDDDIVIDTGSNDNTLLNSYTQKLITKVGFEPASNLMSYAEDANVNVFNEFFAADFFHKKYPGKQAKIITSIAMFYDLEQPNTFVKDIAGCLDQDGVWIIQMMYLPTMLEQNIFDNICHEHLEYYSLQSLNYLLDKHGLKIIDAELNDVNGGSIRTYVTHKRNTFITPFKGSAERLERLYTLEKKLQLETLTPYQEFARHVTEIKDQVTSYIKDAVAKGKTVYVYGASTKGNTLLQYFGLDHTVIKAAAERNPAKWGKKTVATFIPIISEEQARAEKPDYFLILPWHFLSEFIHRENDYLKSGGKFIVPLPQFRVIGSEDLKSL